MNKTFSLLFYPKKSKITSDGKVPLYLRITIDGHIAEISTKRSLLLSKWNTSAQKMSGTSEEAKSFNLYLKTFEQQVYIAYQTRMVTGEVVTAQIIKNLLLGTKEKERMLVPIFKEHNAKMSALVGVDYVPGTLQRFETTLKHLCDFMRSHKNITDIAINKIDLSFITDFEFYLKTVRKCENNSTVKYTKNFGKIIRICIANGWLDKDPFINYKSKIKLVERVFLSEEELSAMANKKFPCERLEMVRDIFLFSCYTGLAYIDVFQLSPDQLRTGIDGNLWIFTHRQKTGNKSNIPLLPKAVEIIEKYKDHPYCINKNKVLPVLSNQKLNSYLKEIADVCGIQKELTFHIARHTFATTVTLSNGVPIETVSKMLGPSSIKMTQHYAKILDSKVSADMQFLQDKLMRKSAEAAVVI